MAHSMWINSITGQRLDDDELGKLRDRAHRLYEVNTHIFEDEREALAALGAEAPMDDLRPRPVGSCRVAAA